MYLSQGSTREVHATELHGFLEALPATGLPVVWGGDVNTQIKWMDHDAGWPEPRGPESKGDYMLGYLKSKGLSVTPPSGTNGRLLLADPVMWKLRADRLTWWAVEGAGPNSQLSTWAPT